MSGVRAFQAEDSSCEGPGAAAGLAHLGTAKGQSRAVRSGQEKSSESKPGRGSAVPCEDLGFYSDQNGVPPRALSSHPPLHCERKF